MKRYNYKTKKIYESVSVFSLSLDEFDANGKLIDSKDFEDTYSTLEDAIEDAYDIMTNVAKNDNIDEDDVAYDENGNTVTFTVDDVGKWVFTVNVSQNDIEDDNVSEYDENKFEDNASEDVNESNTEENTNESVAERFAKLRKMFESEEDEESDDNQENGEGSDETSDENGEESDENSDDNQDEDKDEEMKAVIITVKKGDEDKCKDELMDAGISDEDIEILDADEDAKNVDIRIDVNAVMELKDYLSKKGIDLEEEIGGEIVSDDEDSDEDNKENDDENTEDDNEEEFDFDNLGDIFGAEDEE